MSGLFQAGTPPPESAIAACRQPSSSTGDPQPGPHVTTRRKRCCLGTCVCLKSLHLLLQVTHGPERPGAADRELHVSGAHRRRQDRAGQGVQLSNPALLGIELAPCRRPSAKPSAKPSASTVFLTVFLTGFLTVFLTRAGAGSAHVCERTLHDPARHVRVHGAAHRRQAHRRAAGVRRLWRGRPAHRADQVGSYVSSRSPCSSKGRCRNIHVTNGGTSCRC